MSDVRLIERWLPIGELSEESVRERRSMTALPPIYYLHVWWARRPLVASRAAILASLLPETADHAMFLQVLGIHGDPVRAKRLMDEARRTGVRVADPYGYKRAFAYQPTKAEQRWIDKEVGDNATVLDSVAGGGSIPFESRRLGLTTLANDLNPVAAVILRATAEYPATYMGALVVEFDAIAREFRLRMNRMLADHFPQPSAPNEVAITYLWARTITCPYCAGIVPLSPNWRLAPDGTGVLAARPRRGAGITGAALHFPNRR